MNELHASGAFYASMLTRFKCEFCQKPSAFVVEMFSRNLKASLSCCSSCSNQLKKDGWLDTAAAYLAKP